jgi:hypothetical protein
MARVARQRAKPRCLVHGAWGGQAAGETSLPRGGGCVRFLAESLRRHVFLAEFKNCDFHVFTRTLTHACMSVKLLPDCSGARCASACTCTYVCLYTASRLRPGLRWLGYGFEASPGALSPNHQWKATPRLCGYIYIQCGEEASRGFARLPCGVLGLEACGRSLAGAKPRGRSLAEEPF